jgi:protein-S-isoprenylcysteine O-methyltransferase Ste14
MIKRMTIFGIGPFVVVSGIITDIVAGAVAYMYPGQFLIPAGKHHVTILLGIALLIVGIAVVVASARRVLKAFNEGRLATTGTYAWSRNPIYAAYILLVMPAIALMCRAWLMLAASFVMYAVFKFTVRKETAFLREKFGEDFARYESSVSELLFCPPRNPK